MEPTQTKHISEGELRSYLDQQGNEADQEQTSIHLASCPGCQQKAHVLLAQAEHIQDQLDILIPGPLENPLPVKEARRLLQRRLDSPNQEKKEMFKKIFARPYRPLWGALGLVVILASLFAFPSVRAIANSFLGMFRVEQIAVIPIDMDNVPQSVFEAGSRFDQILSQDVEYDYLGEPLRSASVEQAASLAGIPLRFPTELEEQPTLSVSQGMHLTYKVDLSKIRLLLDLIGDTEIDLPSEIDGSTITAEISPMVSATYGDCSRGAAQASPPGSDPDQRVAYWNPACMRLEQFASPVVNAPPGLDIGHIMKAFLRTAGLTPSQVEAYTSTVDWSTTLIFPVPSYTNYLEVQVDGVNGLLVQEPYNYRPQANYQRYNLIWVKDGILYSLSGNGSRQEALAIANSMP